MKSKVSYTVTVEGKPQGLLFWIGFRLCWIKIDGDMKMFHRDVYISKVWDHIALTMKVKHTDVVLKKRKEKRGVDVDPGFILIETTTGAVTETLI